MGPGESATQQPRQLLEFVYLPPLKLVLEPLPPLVAEGEAARAARSPFCQNVPIVMSRGLVETKSKSTKSIAALAL